KNIRDEEGASPPPFSPCHHLQMKFGFHERRIYSIMATSSAKKALSGKNKKNYYLKSIKRNWQLYVFLLPAITYFFIFHYIPMYGVQIAFKEYIANLGIFGSPWVGLEHFDRFFNSYYFWRLLKNTIILNAYNLILFPLPIIFALSLNELKNGPFKKWAQTLTYAPHFISVVVVVGMLVAFLDPSTGLVNHIIHLFGGESIPFLTSPEWFRHIFVWLRELDRLDVGTRFQCARLGGMIAKLHEATKVDDATGKQLLLHIHSPSLLPTIFILFFFNMCNFI